MMQRVILFDVNETLLDLSGLKPDFGRIFGDTAVMSQWFTQLLRSSMVASITHTYHDFAVLGGDALDMMAMRYGIKLSADDRVTILEGMRKLPPHPEVEESLVRLKNAGLRLATLTNSSPRLLKDQLTNAGLMDYFEQTLSVEPTRCYKPAAEVYQHAASHLGVAMDEIRMVAAHDWDIAGAMRAGCAGAFIARPGMVIGPLQEKPDIIGQNMKIVTDQILEKDL